MTTYKGWTIDWCPYRRAYDVVSPDYDPMWLGEEGGWDEGDERFEAETLAEAHAEIDERLADQRA